MKNYDIIIIGGGASGMMCASILNTKKSVAIFEAGFSLGKKILVTGNGRCNLTNINMGSKYYNINIDKYLKAFGSKETIEYFNSIGLDTIIDDQGRVYPFTNSARSVVDILNKRIQTKKNIDVYTNHKVEKVDYIDNKYIVSVNNEKCLCDSLFVATGNIDNNFYENLNLDMVKRVPSLVALKTADSTKNLDGVRINNVKLTATCGKTSMTQEGELLFKDNGLSGIAVFNLSTLFARSKNYNGTILVDLLPNKTEKQTIETIKNRCKIFERVVDIFDGLFVPPIREEIFKRCKIDEQILSQKLSDKSILEISKTIHNLTYVVNGHYDNYQVISGGVDLQNVDENLECKKHKNLYFIGEALDVDGECGGYNLQWAWTSGALVGRHLSK